MYNIIRHFATAFSDYTYITVVICSCLCCLRLFKFVVFYVTLHISMDIYVKSVDMDIDMDVKFRRSPGARQLLALQREEGTVQARQTE